MARRKPQNKLLLISKVLGVAAVICLLIGIGVAWTQHTQNQTVQQKPAEQASSGEPAPSIEKPDDSAFANHQVAPDAPRYLFIPKLEVKAMVRPVGVTAANQIESPSNVFDVGWYTKSAKPGQPGAVVVDGHVSSRETPGVFYRLKNLEKGDVITLQRGDNTSLNYKVIKSQTYDADKVDMAAALVPVHPDKPGLNLISCTGKVVKGTNEFDKRIVVFAEQL